MKSVIIKNKVIGEGLPKICVPITGRTREEIIGQANGIVQSEEAKYIDIVEFRGDFFEDLGDEQKLKQILEKLSQILNDKIILFTIRSKKEGGEPLGFTNPSVKDINSFVIENGLADVVDVELFSGEKEITELIELAKKKDVKIIMSNHDFKTTPQVDDIVSRLVSMQKLGADIAKIALMPENMIHVADVLKATAIMKETHSETPVVTISMGSMGSISRVSGEKFGSAITFATLGHSSAPGQLGVKEAVALTNQLSI